MERIVKKYKHKKTGVIATSDKDTYKVSSEHVLPAYLIEDCQDWEQIFPKLESIRVKMLLFKDYTGVEIFKGDTVWVVKTNGNDYTVSSDTNFNGTERLGYRYFKALQDADEFVNNHRPVYNKNDISKALEKVGKTFPDIDIYMPGIFLVVQTELDKIK